MDFARGYEVLGSPEAVWATLKDPSILKSCITGYARLITRGGAAGFDRGEEKILLVSEG
jgi:carbon monoxide dehydrogenase subunit G